MEKETESHSFVNETIKRRPINKYKLFRKTMITAVGAVLFGGIACVTFLLLEPVISNRLSPEEITKVQFPEEEEETAPKELLTEENVAEENAMEEQAQINAQVKQELNSKLMDSEMALSTYQTIYDELYNIAARASASVVTVTGVSVDTDWFRNEVENTNETSGVMIAKTEDMLYILADINGLPDADTYTVTFANGKSRETGLKKADPNTGLGIFAMSRTGFEEEEWLRYEAIELGNSHSAAIVGRPIVAVGSPLGQSGSVCYGIITSNEKSLTYADFNYKVLTTDITGSENNASGIIVNTKGQLLGVLARESTTSASGALLACFGISDIKQLVEDLSNGEKRLYLGIHGVEVSDKIHEELGIPYGVYVTEVDSGSPAMTSGITNGDIIIQIGSTEIAGQSDYIKAMQSLREDWTVSVKSRRFNGEQYITIEGEIKPEELK